MSQGRQGGVVSGEDLQGWNRSHHFVLDAWWALLRRFCLFLGLVGDGLAVSATAQVEDSGEDLSYPRAAGQRVRDPG